MFPIHRYTSKKACPGPDSRSQIFLAKDQVKATRDGLTWLKKDVALENPPSFGGKKVGRTSSIQIDTRGIF